MAIAVTVTCTNQECPEAGVVKPGFRPDEEEDFYILCGVCSERCNLVDDSNPPPPEQTIDQRLTDLEEFNAELVTALQQVLDPANSATAASLSDLLPEVLMSYTSISQCSRDSEFIVRVEAATVQEAWNNPGIADNDYTNAVKEDSSKAGRMVYPVAIANDIAEAYEFAINSGNPNPGGDPAVITDGMILANVAAKWPEDVTP